MQQRPDVRIFADYPALPQLARLQWPMVLGDWPACPQAVLVGEGPGQEEVMIGRPFVGRAGQRLDTLLREAGLDRLRLGVTNVAKGRPTDATGQRDRPPSIAEAQVSVPYLWRELDLMAGQHTRILCALGHTAIKALSGYDGPVGQVAGSWVVVTDPVGMRWIMFSTYHPSAALRNEEMNAALARHLKQFASEIEQWGARALAQLG